MNNAFIQIIPFQTRILKIAAGFLFGALAACPGSAETISYNQICSGVHYAHITRPEVPLSIHVIKFDYHRQNLKLLSTLAQGTVFGLASVRKEVAALPPSAGEPIAAINGDFFLMKKDPYQGDTRGLQISAGELISSPSKDACFWMDPAGHPHMGVVHSKCRVRWPNGMETPIRINEQHPLDGISLMTPVLGPSTRTTNGVELILEPYGSGPWLPLKAGQTYTARVRDIHRNGDVTIAPNSLILSIGPKLVPLIPTLEPGMRLKIVTDLTPKLKGVQTAIGGGPVLVAKGQARQWASGDIRNPRSAIGWDKEDFYFVVVDGRQKDLSIGVTFGDLARIMVELGCKEALNLDGGGSSTLWMNGEVANHPSEKGVERNVANALVLVRQ